MAVCWMRLKDIIVCGDKTGNLVLYSLISKKIKKYQIKKGQITCFDSILFNKECYLAIGYKDGTILIAKADTELEINVLFTLNQHSLEILKIQLVVNEIMNKEFPILISCSLDQYYIVFNNLNKKESNNILSLKLDKKKYKDEGFVAFDVLNEEELQLIVANKNGKLNLWKVVTNKIISIQNKKEDGHKRSLFSILINQHQQSVITYSLDRKIICWDLKSYKIKKSTDTLNSPISNVSIAQWDKSLVAIANNEDKIKILKLDGKQKKLEVIFNIWNNIHHSVNKIQFHPEIENQLWFVCNNGQIGKLNIRNQKIKTLNKSNNNNKIMNNNVNNSNLIEQIQIIKLKWIGQLNDLDNLELLLLEEDEMRIRNNKKENESEFNVIAVLYKSGKLLFYHLNDISIIISNSLINILKINNEENIQLTQFQFINNGNYFTLGYSNGKMNVYLTKNYCLIYSFINICSPILAIAENEEFTMLAIGFDDGSIILVNCDRFKMVQKERNKVHNEYDFILQKQKSKITSLQFKTSFLLSTSIDGTSLVYQIENNITLVSILLLDYSKPVNCGIWINNKLIISGFNDCKLLLWDFNCWKEKVNNFKKLNAKVEVKNKMSEEVNIRHNQNKKIKYNHTDSTIETINNNNKKHQIINIKEENNGLSTASSTIENRRENSNNNNNNKLILNQLLNGELISCFNQFNNSNNDQNHSIIKSLLLLSLSPLLGNESYYQMMEKVAGEMSNNNNNNESTLIGVVIYLYMGKIELAIQCLVKNQEFELGLKLIESNNLINKQKLIVTIYEKYNQYLIEKEEYIKVMENYLKFKEYSKAANIVLNCKDKVLGSKMALDLAMKYQLQDIEQYYEKLISICLKKKEILILIQYLDDKYKTNSIIIAMYFWTLLETFSWVIEGDVKLRDIIEVDNDNELKKKIQFCEEQMNSSNENANEDEIELDFNNSEVNNDKIDIDEIDFNNKIEKNNELFLILSNVFKIQFNKKELKVCFFNTEFQLLNIKEALIPFKSDRLDEMATKIWKFINWLLLQKESKN
ncbi:WD40 repeat-like protein [Neoconidiobolus thromboides FSU 785]|nr:WD40 repeat-like protein [Neoconidiobolus thromboides FSU 785]